MQHLTRKVAWALFWLTTFLALLVVLLFVYAAAPVLFAIARGGYGHIFFFGNTGFIVLASALYLAIVAAVFLKNRLWCSSHRLGT